MAFHRLLAFAALLLVAARGLAAPDASQPGAVPEATEHLVRARAQLAPLLLATHPRPVSRELEQARRLLETLASRPTASQAEVGRWLLATSEGPPSPVQDLRREVLKELDARGVFLPGQVGPLLRAAASSDFELDQELTRTRRLIWLVLLGSLLRFLFYLGLFLLAVAPLPLRILAGPRPQPGTPDSGWRSRLWRRYQLLLRAAGTLGGAAFLVLLTLMMRIPGGILAALLVSYLGRRERLLFEAAARQAAATRSFRDAYLRWSDLYTLGLHPLKNLLAELERGEDPAATLAWLGLPPQSKALAKRRATLVADPEGGPPALEHSLASLIDALDLLETSPSPAALGAAWDRCKATNQAVAAWLDTHRLRLGEVVLEPLLAPDGTPKVVRGAWSEQSLGAEDPTATAAALTAILRDLVQNSLQVGATTITLELERGEGRRPVIRVRDDGPGSGGDAGTDPAGIKAGTGLAAAREWTERRGGELTWGDAPQGGFLVTLALPLEGISAEG